MKTRWSAEEVQQTFREAKTIWPQEPNFGLLQVIKKAQLVLPTHRRRKMTSVQQVNPTLRRLLTEFRASPEFRQEPLPAPLPEALPKPTILEELLEKFTEELALQLAAKLRFHLKQRAAGILGEAAIASVEGDRQRKRKVMLIGGDVDQHNVLHKSFDKLLDLRTPAKGDTNASWGSHLQSRAADFQGIVLVWTDFVPHSAYNTVPPEKLMKVSGGLTSVKEKLEEIYTMTT